jgi:signal transduction histidine kinase
MTHVMVFDGEPGPSTGLADALKTAGFRVTAAGEASTAREAIRRERPALAVVSEGLFHAVPDGTRLRMATAEASIPLLVVVDDVGEPKALSERLAEADDWVSRRALDAELPARVARLLHRRDARPPARTQPAAADPPTDSQLFALVIHDLRTPLNVIGLSLRMINQAVPPGDADLEEDIRFVDENFRQIERMLAQLSDFYRLFENEGRLNPTPFDPRRLVNELLETWANKAGAKTSPVRLDLRPDCPAEVDLDPARARQAIQYVLVNANASAGGDPVRLSMHGGPDRWVIEATIDKAAPPSVQSVALSPSAFERLCGFAAERRGMDLAIAAKVTELFGGTARLDVTGARGTTVVLDWPARITPAAER